MEKDTRDITWVSVIVSFTRPTMIRMPVRFNADTRAQGQAEPESPSEVLSTANMMAGNRKRPFAREKARQRTRHVVLSEM